MVYLTEQGSKLCKQGNRLIVEKDEMKLADLPLIKVQTILIYGNVQITTQALRLLLDEGVETALFTFNGRFCGSLSPAKSKNIVLRMRHYEKARNETVALGIAKRIVSAKIQNMQSMMRSFLKNYPNPDISLCILELKKWFEKIDHKCKAQNLLGVEGSATVKYFDMYKRMFRGEIRFSGRNRRPPQDEANALMSFSYVLVGNELTLLLNACGLDPYLGFYHGIQYGRASLGLDMLEPFRPTVDRFVLYLVNLGIFKKSDFTAREGGIYLLPDALKRFFGYYEKFMTKPDASGKSIREYIRLQVENLVKTIMDDRDFLPFSLS